eukprot:1521474-Rhodomonas_salina.2
MHRQRGTRYQEPLSPRPRFWGLGVRYLGFGGWGAWKPPDVWPRALEALDVPALLLFDSASDPRIQVVQRNAGGRVQGSPVWVLGSQNVGPGSRVQGPGSRVQGPGSR